MLAASQGAVGALYLLATSPKPVISTRRIYTEGVMDGECAFCGRADGAARQVFCEDCAAQHRVCISCANEVAADADGYRLVA